MSRKTDSIKQLALHPGTGETEWQAAAIAYFRILRSNGGKEPEDKPSGVRMEHPMYHNPEPWYPFGTTAARADEQERERSEYFRSVEEQARRQDQMRREREARGKARQEWNRKISEQAFSAHFGKKWNDDVVQKTASKVNDFQDVMRIAADMAMRAGINAEDLRDVHTAT